MDEFAERENVETSFQGPDSFFCKVEYEEHALHNPIIDDIIRGRKNVEVVGLLSGNLRHRKTSRCP